MDPSPSSPEAWGPTPPIRQGEVRPYGEPLPGPTTSDERTMAMLCHLLAIFTGFIGPLVIWLIRKNESRFVDAHGREALNFSLTVLAISLLGAGCFAALFFGLFASLAGSGGGQGPSGAAAGASSGLIIGLCFFEIVMIAVGIYALVMEIIACVAASKGRMKRYPIAIRFFGRVEPFGG